MTVQVKYKLYEKWLTHDVDTRYGSYPDMWIKYTYTSFLGKQTSVVSLMDICVCNPKLTSSSLSIDEIKKLMRYCSSSDVVVNTQRYEYFLSWLEIIDLRDILMIDIEDKIRANNKRDRETAVTMQIITTNTKKAKQLIKRHNKYGYFTFDITPMNK